MKLSEYKDLIGAAASVSSIGLILAPSLICFQIWKRKSSQNIPIYPIMEGLARSTLILQQGIVMGVLPMVFTHSFGLILHLIYVGIYLIFATDKGEAMKSILSWSSFLVPMIAYANYEDKSLVEARFANLVTGFMISLMLFHLYNVRKVFISKSTKDLPFPILVAALCVTFLWTLYGIAIDKPALQMQTGFGFLVCAFELSLFAIFPSKPAESKKTK